MIEIDENLIRNDLSEALRTKLVKRRAQIVVGAMVQLGPRGIGARQPTAGVSEVARLTGQSRWVVGRMVRRGLMVPDDVLDDVESGVALY